MTFVVDASIIIRLLANRQADEMLRRRLASPRTVHAPQLVDAEVASGVRGLLLGKRIGPPRAAEMISDFSALRITRHPMQPYLHRVLELRDNLTAYDAFYVALAEGLRMPLLTRDVKFGGGVGHTAEIQVYP
ncbi:MAG: PIN domain-containing protein [Streptosporangiales bacterium]|nr:PIN domain-containing protein [Streptosporangiales bacterium]